MLCRKEGGAMLFQGAVQCLVVLFVFLGRSDAVSQPNIVLILTDDQDVVLQGLIPMTATQKNLAFKGITFNNAFTSSPICCPSRASILSGQYAHNHASINNSVSGGCYGDFWKERVERRTIAVQLENLGYETFFAGKYLNQYHSDNVPPGWSKFYGLHGNSRYYNYSLTENGEVVSYTDEYLTDVLKEKALDFLKSRESNKPFFAMIAPPAPHAPFTPAPRHNLSFEGVKVLQTLNFNVAFGPLDKHWLVNMRGPFPDSLIPTLDNYYRSRWQSLLAVDELVESIVQHLESAGQIDNTYIVFTSDNGYHMGQFGQPFDKRQPYETDIRVPFLVRGPNIQPKSITNAPIALIDLFPTFLEWAGGTLTGYEDGESFNRHIVEQENEITSDRTYHRSILIEYWGEGNIETYNPACPWKLSDDLAECTLDADCYCQDARNNTYSCIRHFAFNTDKIYCEFRDSEDFVEAYDLSTDIYQMQNIGYSMLPSERALYSLSLRNLTECMGKTCRESKI